MCIQVQKLKRGWYIGRALITRIVQTFMEKSVGGSGDQWKFGKQEVVTV